MIFNLTQPVLDSAPKFTYTGTYEYIDDGGGDWRIKFLTSGVFTPLKDILVDIFLVGGGAGGLSVASYSKNAYGGGGGYTTTKRSITLKSGVEYNIIIGAGGAANTNGGDTSFDTTTANGGKAGASGSHGGNGGSGGAYAGGNGGSDGGNGSSRAGTSYGGVGQGTTTREFGESTGELYAGGGAAKYDNYNSYSGGDGGGGGVVNGNVTPAEDGKGGGGAGGSNGSCAGGSGIVIIRKHKEAA